jgi:hypothetical protein
VPAATYEIHLRGRLSPAIRANFPGLSSSEWPVETVLYGRIRDDAELHAILERIQSMGLELLDLHRAADRFEPDGEKTRARGEPSAAGNAPMSLVARPLARGGSAARSGI